MAQRRSDMRASDADREQIAERLRCATDEGRLLAHEFDERLDTALQARTYGELDAIVADLPRRRAAMKRAGRAGTLLRRPSDADRDRIAERLRDATAEGRLLVDEFDERLEQALSARTYRELDGIVADLPRKRAMIKRSGSARTVERRRARSVKRAARAGKAILHRRRTLVAGALAAVAVAAPLIVTEVGASGPSAPALHAGGDSNCTNHWTKTSKELPCDWGKIASQAYSTRILNDVINANDRG